MAIFTLSRIPFDDAYSLLDMSLDTLHKGAVKAEILQIDITESGDFGFPLRWNVFASMPVTLKLNGCIVIFVSLKQKG